MAGNPHCLCQNPAMSSELESGLRRLVERSLLRLGQACPEATADPAALERLSTDAELQAHTGA